MFRFLRPTALLCVLALSIPAAADEEGDALMESLFEKLDSLETWSADFTVGMNMGGMTMNMGGAMKMKGEMSYSVLDMDMMGQAMKMTTVVDKEGVIWMDMDTMGQRQIMKMDGAMMKEMAEQMGGTIPGLNMSGMGGGFGSSQDPRTMLEGFKDMFDLTVAPDEELDGVAVHVLQGGITEEAKSLMDPTGQMAQMGMSFDRLRTYISKDDGMVRKIEMGGGDMPFMTLTYSNIELNPALEASVFEFTPPEGVMVMDLSDMMNAGSFDAGAEEAYNTKFAVGDVAPDFEATDLAGKTLKLSDYRGKVVLIDFWATWCGPCIQELPNVIETYGTYHPKGLEILAVSLDDERDDLDGFLAEHGDVTWRQLFDGKGWQGDIGVLYGVEAIPHTLLLDQTGTIRGVGLRGDELDAAVAELLSEGD